MTDKLSIIDTMFAKSMAGTHARRLLADKTVSKAEMSLFNSGWDDNILEKQYYGAKIDVASNTTFHPQPQRIMKGMTMDGKIGRLIFTRESGCKHTARVDLYDDANQPLDTFIVDISEEG